MSYRVLIVDDSAIIRNMLKKALLRTDESISAILEATNGSEALDILRKEWVDIVFTDINMPEMTGTELIEAMHGDELLRSIPIVVITSVRSMQLKAELMQKGVKKYIRKPFRPEQLSAVIREILAEEWR